MQTHQIPLDETECFSSFFLDYISQKPELADFYTKFPTLENFKSVIENRNFNDDHRSILVDVLQAQYAETPTSDKVEENIEALKDSKTFTITTGHQLNIFTGPLYFIYKIVTVINTCKRLKEAYPAYHFVPAYWMASEDHDFDEINHFFFEGAKYEWNTEQTGAVGRFHTDELKRMAQELPNSAAFFKDAYAKGSLSEAGRYYVNHLFKDEGLVVIDADHAALKKLFAPVIAGDVLSHVAEKIVVDTSKKLTKLGYKPQVNCRNINFFYLENGTRERIEKQGSTFHVLETDLAFSESEIKDLIEEHPEQFSPNVILRPLYQETILPNLAYIGGPSEAVYWLQLKDLFDHFQTAFPLLMPRNFALVIPEKEQTKWEKNGFSNQDLFLSKRDALEKWVKQNTDKSLSFANEIQGIRELYHNLKGKAEPVDTTLLPHLDALKTVTEKRLQIAEKKLLRAEKRKHKDTELQINAVKDALFPNGSLQERRDNFLNFYASDPSFIQKLLETFDPFEYTMYLLLQ